MRDHWPMSAMTMAGRLSPLGVGLELVFGGDLFRPPKRDIACRYLIPKNICLYINSF